MYANIANLLTQAVDRLAKPSHDNVDETISLMFNPQEYIKLREERRKKEQIANVAKGAIAVVAAVGEGVILYRNRQRR